MLLVIKSESLAFSLLAAQGEDKNSSVWYLLSSQHHPPIAPPDCDGSHRPPHHSSRDRQTTRCSDARVVPAQHIVFRRELIHTLSLHQYSRVSYAVEHHLQLYYHDPRMHLHFIPSRRPKPLPHVMEDPRRPRRLRIHRIPHSGVCCSESGGAVEGGLGE
jgi:hypothetical protein